MSFKVVAEKLLMITGIISLVGMVEDIIKLAGIVNTIVEYYREIISPVFEFIQDVIGIPIPRIYQDIIIFFFSILSGANVYVYRTSGNLVLGKAYRNVFIEKKMPFKGDDFEIPKSASDAFYRIFFYLIYTTNYFICWCFASVLILLAIFLTIELTDHLRELPFVAIIFLIYFFLMIAYKYAVTVLDYSDNIANYFHQIIRNIAIFITAIFKLIASSWRYQIYALTILMCVLLLNELHLRFETNNIEIQNCILYSIPETCE